MFAGALHRGPTLVTGSYTHCALDVDDYVRVFAFDFSKAFGTVRHYTLMKKMATLELPYNWDK